MAEEFDVKEMLDACGSNVVEEDEEERIGEREDGNGRAEVPGAMVTTEPVPEINEERSGERNQTAEDERNPVGETTVNFEGALNEIKQYIGDLVSAKNREI